MKIRVLAEAGTRSSLPLIDLQAQRRRLGSRIDRAIARVLDHGAFILGPEVRELERLLAEFCGAQHVVACASGTDALQLALMAHAVGAGDAVLVPAFTFAATAEAVARAGATPVFVDVGRRSFSIDPASLEAAIGRCASLGLRARAVIAVDLFGCPADYPALERVARDHRLLLIADAAQSFGGSLGGRGVGTIGDVAATSFYPSKPLGCYGDGGAVFTADDAIAGTVRSLRQHGCGSDRNDAASIGLNSRLDTLQAAILIEKLAIFDEEIEARQRIAARYRAGLMDVLDVPEAPDSARSVWAVYTVQLDRRDDVAAGLEAAGIATGVYYRIPLHRQTAYRRFPTAPGGLPVAEALAGRVLSLPMHAYLEPGQQDLVIDAVRAAIAAR